MTLRWGILGTASIARRRLVPAIGAAPSATLAAIASREAARAEEAVAAAGAGRPHGSYEALLADPGVDAVYIPLPNALHLPWTRRALDAGKHVLCEKPLGCTAAQAEEILIAAGEAGRAVMEAFMYRFHPRWEAIHAMTGEGAIGTLTAVHTHFSYMNTDPADIRNDPGLGGGGLLDIGCYGASVARWLFSREPAAVRGRVERDPHFGTDRMASAVLDFAPGHATFTAATQLPWHQHVSIHGTLGRIEVERPFNPVPESSSRLLVHQGDAVREITFAPADQYAVMVERFSRAVLDGTPVPTALDDAIANARVLDAVGVT